MASLTLAGDASRRDPAAGKHGIGISWRPPIQPGLPIRRLLTVRVVAVTDPDWWAARICVRWRIGVLGQSGFPAIKAIGMGLGRSSFGLGLPLPATTGFPFRPEDRIQVGVVPDIVDLQVLRLVALFSHSNLFENTG